jgi:hypothetical protein
VAEPSGHSPALIVGILAGLAGVLLPALKELVSFGIFYSADEASDRKVMLSAAASVMGMRHLSILDKRPLELAANHRHGTICSDIPSDATEKQVSSLFRGLFRAGGGQIGGNLLPEDIRLLAFTTGRDSQLGSVPQSISVSAIVHPELRLYDDLGGQSTPEQMNARIVANAAKHRGVAGRQFILEMERCLAQSADFGREVKKLANDFFTQLHPKTAAERERAWALALFWAAGVLGIKWKILPWSEQRVKSVLNELFVAACRSLPDPQARKENATEELRQLLLSSRKLDLVRYGHNMEYTPKEVQEADVFIEGNYMHVPAELVARWLPNENSRFAISYLDEQSLLRKEPSRRSRAVQKTIAGIRSTYYAIHISFLGAGYQPEPENDDNPTADAASPVQGEAPILLERITEGLGEYKATQSSTGAADDAPSGEATGDDQERPREGGPT